VVAGQVVTATGYSLATGYQLPATT